MSIRPTNGSRSLTAPAAGQRQQTAARSQQEQQQPEQLLATSQSYYIIGEHRYSWERALGSHSGAGGARLPPPPMYSHDPRIGLFGAAAPSQPPQPSSPPSPPSPSLPPPPPSSNNRLNSLLNPTHYYPSPGPVSSPTPTHSRIVAGSNNFNHRSRNTRNAQGQQQHPRTHANVPLNVPQHQHQQQQQRGSARAATSINTLAALGNVGAHGEHSVRATAAMQQVGAGACAGATQMREIGRKYPLWLPEYKRRAFNVSPPTNLP